MSQAPSMPTYWDAYIADTTHLTLEEHGAYLLLLAAMWRRNGWIPDDDRDNARILGIPLARWKKIKARLAAFLIFKDGSISQKNLLKIWKKTQETIEKNRENGAKGGRPKANKNNDIAKANGSVWQNPNETIPEPEPEPEIAVQYSAREKPDDFQVLSKALTEAIGEEAVARSPGLLVMADPLAWIAGGCDLQADILPTIAAIKAKGKRVGSWSYFSQAVYEARDRRLAPSPPVEARSPPASRSGGRRRTAYDVFKDAIEELNHEQGESGNRVDAISLPGNA